MALIPHTFSFSTGLPSGIPEEGLVSVHSAAGLSLGLDPVGGTGEYGLSLGGLRSLQSENRALRVALEEALLNEQDGLKTQISHAKAKGAKGLSGRYVPVPGSMTVPQMGSGGDTGIEGGPQDSGGGDKSNAQGHSVEVLSSEEFREEEEDEECAWAPGSPTGRQGTDLMAAKAARQAAAAGGAPSPLRGLGANLDMGGGFNGANIGMGGRGGYESLSPSPESPESPERSYGDRMNDLSDIPLSPLAGSSTSPKIGSPQSMEGSGVSLVQGGRVLDVVDVIEEIDDFEDADFEEEEETETFESSFKDIPP